MAFHAPRFSEQQACLDDIMVHTASEVVDDVDARMWSVERDQSQEMHQLQGVQEGWWTRSFSSALVRSVGVLGLLGVCLQVQLPPPHYVPSVSCSSSNGGSVVAEWSEEFADSAAAQGAPRTPQARQKTLGELVKEEAAVLQKTDAMEVEVVEPEDPRRRRSSRS